MTYIYIYNDVKIVEIPDFTCRRHMYNHNEQGSQTPLEIHYSSRQKDNQLDLWITFWNSKFIRFIWWKGKFLHLLSQDWWKCYIHTKRSQKEILKTGVAFTNNLGFDSTNANKPNSVLGIKKSNFVYLQNYIWLELKYCYSSLN